MAKTALILGATGLVGEQCLTELLASPAYDKVIVMARKKPEIKNPKLEIILTGFENLEGVFLRIKADDIFCALGTTIGKAGSKAAFRKIDFEIPLKVAEIAQNNGAKKFILVSSLGANSSSPVFYSKTKGELENALLDLKYETLLILRPSILLGNRKERRFGEEIGRLAAEKFSFLFTGALKKYKGTPADLLGRLMVHLAQKNITGTRIIENEGIFDLAQQA